MEASEEGSKNGDDGGGGRRRRRGYSPNGLPTAAVYVKPQLPPLRLNGLEGHNGKVSGISGRRRRKNATGAGRGAIGGQSEGTEGEAGLDSGPSRSNKLKEGDELSLGAEGNRHSKAEHGEGGSSGKVEAETTLRHQAVLDQGDDTDDGTEASGDTSGLTLEPPRPAPPRHRAANSSPAKPLRINKLDEEEEQQSPVEKSLNADKVLSKGDREEGKEPAAEDDDEDAGGEVYKQPFVTTLWNGKCGFTGQHGCRRAGMGIIVFVVIIIVLAVRESQKNSQ